MNGGETVMKCVSVLQVQESSVTSQQIMFFVKKGTNNLNQGPGKIFEENAEQMRL
jgi:hypothetical protein